MRGFAMHAVYLLVLFAVLSPVLVFCACSLLTPTHCSSLAASTYQTHLTHPHTTLLHRDIRGLAAPLRMMCEYAGVPYTDSQYEAIPRPEGGYDFSQWLRSVVLY